MEIAQDGKMTYVSENNFLASRFAKDGWLTKTLKSRASTNLNFMPHASLEVICWIKPLVPRFSSFWLS